MASGYGLNVDNNKFVRFIHNKIRRIRIHNRLFFSIALLSLVPLLITGIFAYYKSSLEIKSQISSYSVELLNQVSEKIQSEITKYENESVEIAYLDIVQDTLRRYHSLNEWERFDAEQKMQNLLSKKFAFSSQVTDVLIYTVNLDKIIAYGDVYFQLKLNQEFLEYITSNSLSNKGVPMWVIQTDDEEKTNAFSYRKTNYGESGIVLARSFRSLTNGVTNGYILLRINENYISNLFKEIDMGSGSAIFIMDTSGKIISTNHPARTSESMFDNQGLIDEILMNNEMGKYAFPFSQSSDWSLVAYSHIPGADWYIVSMIPFSHLNKVPISIGLYIFILGIICFLLALIFSYILSKSISNPLNRLLESMNKLTMGNFNFKIVDHSIDELGVVTSKFNSMVKELEFLIQEVKDKENMKRLAELKALQAQINPHFLSNTLNTVRWMANLQKADNISSLISSLIEMLHGSMGKGKEVITIEEEIGYAKNYLNIMTYRYYDKFQVHFDIEEEILSYQIIRFTLQPIVENALLHGLAPSSRKGLIIIKGYREKDEIKLTVTDNGIGFSDSVSLPPLSGESKSSGPIKFSGIGLDNVDKRIKYYFGEMYGISIQSSPHLFTTIEITIPAIQGEEFE